MKNFFKDEFATEFFVPDTNEIWVFGAEVNEIDLNTPHIFVGRDPHWAHDGKMTAYLPITDGHGNREYVSGFFCTPFAYELAGTTAETAISKFWNFNA